MELVKAKGIRKSYQETEGELQILKGLDLIVEQGETVAITGESGSGKSTLLHILGLLDQADQGEIFFRGELLDTRSIKADEFRNSKLGFIFQFHYLLEDFTALENVALPNFYLTGKRKAAEQKAAELLKKLNLEGRESHFPNQLSGGEQQRVAVARALINEPDIVYADEPTGNLDYKHSSELVDILIDLNHSRGQTFVMVTHDRQIAEQMQKQYVLENGVLRVR
ncbi:MAG: ABC transporter ATP-binding protein [Candidatus Stygibacter australis]|nr:ABC transporter ATP-binding protein [Candidatus Stygibacter australis]MDP8322283.1 ABC transporter ATP-binding protein [Candidatus Stygibacter australis]